MSQSVEEERAELIQARTSSSGWRESLVEQSRESGQQAQWGNRRHQVENRNIREREEEEVQWVEGVIRFRCWHWQVD